MVLTDTAVRQAKRKDRGYTLAEGNGLALFVHPRGGKYWHFRYRANGKGNRISLGIYPEVSLENARLRREEARRRVAADVDPRGEPREARCVMTFRQVVNEWDAFRTTRLSQCRKGAAAQCQPVSIHPAAALRGFAWLANRRGAVDTKPQRRRNRHSAMFRQTRRTRSDAQNLSQGQVRAQLGERSGKSSTQPGLNAHSFDDCVTEGMDQESVADKDMRLLARKLR